MPNNTPKSDQEWLAETADSAPLTKEKLSIIGQIGLKDIAPLVLPIKENQDV